MSASVVPMISEMFFAFFIEVALEDCFASARLVLWTLVSSGLLSRFEMAMLGLRAVGGFRYDLIATDRFLLCGVAST